MERCIAERLMHHIGPQLSDHQHGFRRAHSTSDAVWTLVDDILRAFGRYENTGRRVPGRENAKTYYTANRVVAVLYDLTAAFDKVDLAKLIDKLSASGVDLHTQRWIRNFVVSRTARVKVDDECPDDHEGRRPTRNDSWAAALPRIH